MFIIGVTGGIGTGKSTAASMIGAWGVPVLDADQISHEVTAKGGRALPRIVEAFGREVLGPDGGMDRDYVSQLVFQDRKLLDELSFIVHEEVMATLAQETARAEKAGEKAIVLDVPIPVHKGFLDTCHEIVVIDCNEDTRLQRLALRGMNATDAKRRMAMQMTSEEYAAIGTMVVENNGSKETLEKALRETIGEALIMRGVRLKASPEPAEADDL